MWHCDECDYDICMGCRPSRKFGLYDDHNAALLKALDTDVQINNSIVRVELSQIYENTKPFPIETEYYFPVNDIGVFDTFVAVFKDKEVQGVIKKKEQAKKEYLRGKKAGHFMAYAETKEKTPLDFYNLI